MVGGGVDAGGATFGKIAGKVPGRRVKDVIDRLAGKFYMTPSDRSGKQVIKTGKAELAKRNRA